MASTYCEIGTLITRDPKLRGGRPIIAGTGTCVRTIVTEYNHGSSPEEIVADRDYLTLAQVHAALAYYFANKTEIDDDLEAERLAYEEGVRNSRMPIRP